MERATAFLRDEVSPRANEIDADVAALRWALDGLSQRGLMALRAPKRFGGPEVPEAQFREFQEMVARYSGSLAFLQTQHQSAVSLIRTGDNEALKAEYLPQMSDGTKLVGIGFSQLRRPGPPLVTAERVEGGYQIRGHVPWITGHTFYPEFMIAGQLPDESAIFGIIPFISQSGITISEPMRLAAMESGQTVTADVDWFLPDAMVVAKKPPHWIHTNDQINITLQGFFALGCARGSLDIIAANSKKKRSDATLSAHGALTFEVDSCRARMADSAAASELTTPDKLNLRAWAIDLAVRCAHAAITTTGGSANSTAHAAQRLYREALVYTVSAQTVPIMEATLARLVR